MKMLGNFGTSVGARGCFSRNVPSLGQTGDFSKIVFQKLSCSYPERNSSSLEV